jgi:phage gpG-like protein
MSKPITVSAEMLNLEPFKAQLRGMKSAVRGPILKTALARAGEVVRLYATNNIRDWNLIDTGALVNSISVSVKTASKAVWIFSNMVYAAIHEFGGTIYPVNAKKLAVPMRDEAENYSPRNFPGELHPVGGEGGLVLVDESGLAQYALVDSVEIPEKPYLGPAVTEHMDEIENAFADAIREGIAASLNGAGG